MGKRLGLIVLVVLVAAMVVGWSPAGYVQGQVKLQGRSGGASLVAVCGRQVWTDSKGRFYVACLPGNYTVKAFHASYLTATAVAEVKTGQITNLGATTLVGGDVGGDIVDARRQDNRIDSTDWLIVWTLQGQPAQVWPAADVNGDWRIDEKDLRLVLQQNEVDALEIVGPTVW